MAIITPDITFPDIPTPPPPPPEYAPVVWEAYGTLVHDYIDGQIQDFAAYYTPIMVVRDELNLLRSNLFRKYHRARKELLQIEGRKNLTLMPGYLQRKLMDMALDEKRELSEEAIKITAKYVDASLDSVYAGAEMALKSDAIRSDMHAKSQSMTFEVAKAAIMAAYENSKQRITTYESSLKAIATEFELIIIECKALADAVEADISAIRIEILAAENIGTAEELEAVAAQLEVSRTQILEAQSRLPLIAAEIAKAYGEMDILKAEQLLATFKELAANASMDKSHAREGEIEISRQKIALELAKIELQTEKDSAETSSTLSEIEARRAEEELENTKATRRVLQIDTEAVLTKAKKSIAEADRTAADEKIVYLGDRANTVVTRVTNRATERTSDITNRANSEKGAIDSRATERKTAIEERATERSSDLDSRATDTADDLEQRANDRSDDLSQRATDKKSDLDARASERVTALGTRQSQRVSEYTARKSDRVSKLQSQAGDKESRLDNNANDLSSNADERVEKLGRKINNIRNAYDSWKSSYADALQAEAQGMLEAAANASSAKVDTTYVYTKGTGTPPTPEAPETPNVGRPELPDPWDEESNV